MVGSIWYSIQIVYNIIYIRSPEWSILPPSDAGFPRIPSTFLVLTANSSKRPLRYPSSLSPKSTFFLTAAKQTNRVRSFLLSTGMVGITLAPFFCLRRRWTPTSTCERNMREEWHRRSWKSRILYFLLDLDVPQTEKSPHVLRRLQGLLRTVQGACLVRVTPRLP